MSKKPAGKSIIANFGAISAISPVLEEGCVPRVPLQPIARVGAGVIGATQRSLSDIREERDRLQAIVAAGGGLEITPSLIDPSPFPDRLPDDTDIDFETLKKLISEEGQKVPIQVRTHPCTSGRYQVVYGHRRWRACRDLGLKVKAILVELTDIELVVAQGIENAARQDLSWIERALFAWRMDSAGIKARDIRAALAIDDPELARLRAVCRTLPIETIEAIGRAPRVGRPRWVELATLIANEPKAAKRIQETLSDDKVLALPSDERFRRVLQSIKQALPEKVSMMELKSPHGDVVGQALFSGGNVKLAVEKSQSVAFAAFLKAHLPDLMQRFFSREDGG